MGTIASHQRELTNATQLLAELPALRGNVQGEVRDAITDAVRPRHGRQDR
jgi:hypothetical protein